MVVVIHKTCGTREKYAMQQTSHRGLIFIRGKGMGKMGGKQGVWPLGTGTAEEKRKEDREKGEKDRQVEKTRQTDRKVDRHIDRKRQKGGMLAGAV